MHVLFRADASPRLGAGHAMRCVALAHALKADGASVSFATRDPAGAPQLAMDAMRDLGHVTVLPDRRSAPSEDALETILAMDREERLHGPIDWVVVDHYGLGVEWERTVASRTRARIIVIDDLATREHDCEVLLDQNFKGQARQRYEALTPPGCALLLGPRFALLRPEFAAARAGARRSRGRLRKILVTFGGTDPTNETAKVLRAVGMLGDPALRCDVVLGSYERHPSDMSDAVDGRVRFHRNVRDMTRLMLDSDLAICAGGSTTWERMCIGLPGIVIATADNQVETSEHLAARGFQWYLGKSSTVRPADIAGAIIAIQHDFEALARVSDAGAKLVDGMGAVRVREVMLGSVPSSPERSA